jgi:hypothetical protein
MTIDALASCFVTGLGGLTVGLVRWYLAPASATILTCGLRQEREQIVDALGLVWKPEIGRHRETNIAAPSGPDDFLQIVLASHHRHQLIWQRSAGFEPNDHFIHALGFKIIKGVRVHERVGFTIVRDYSHD